MFSKIYLAQHPLSLHHSKSKTSKKQSMKKVGSFSTWALLLFFKKFGSGSGTNHLTLFVNSGELKDTLC
jgi:hypothetical protein